MTECQVCRIDAGASVDGVCAFLPSTSVCRAAAGACDVAEACTGLSAACPADALAPPTTVCRNAAGDCDVAESCTGTTVMCPADAFSVSTTMCRAAACSGNNAISEATCSGASASCPSEVSTSCSPGTCSDGECVATPDAGTGGGTGGTGGGSGMTGGGSMTGGGGGDSNPPPSGCGCTSMSPVSPMLTLGALAFWLQRRRRNVGTAE